MDSFVIRPITEKDIVALMGQPLRHTCTGWAVDYKGDVAGIAGVLMTRPLVLAFAHVRDDLSIPKITIWRAALKLFMNIKSLNYPVIYALASPRLPGAPAFLERLGFTHIETSARGEIFKWQIQ